MRARAAWILGTLGTAAVAAAQGQTEGSARYTLTVQTITQQGGSWSNWPMITAGGNITGPNQGILFKLNMALYGTPGLSEQHWTPNEPAGTSGIGTLLGFWNGDIEVMGSGSDVSGRWSDNSTAWWHYGWAQQAYISIRRHTRAPFSAGQLNGTVMPDGGGVTDIMPAQFTPDPSAISPLAPGTVWQGLWIPSDLTPRTVAFTPSMGALGLLSQVAILDDNGTYTLPIIKNIQTLFGPGVTVTIIPGPSALAILGFAGLIAAPRGRARGSG
jgi:hypothetical protein